MLENATELNSVLANMPFSQRMQDLQGQYHALGSMLGPSTADQLSASRKTMRALQAPAANAGVRY
jgi:hypothetical protein